MKANGTRAWADITLALVAVLLVVGFSPSCGLAQQAATRAGADTARSATGGLGRGEAAMSPGRRMVRRVLREAFPKPNNGLRRPMPSAQPPAAAIPARNAIGLRLVAPANPVGAAQKPPFSTGVGVTPNAAIASPSLTRGGRLSVEPRGPTPSVPAPNALRPSGINGSSIVRIGSGPAGIGGAAPSVTGINGTSIRPKHQP